jgi:(R)-2-hydroxyacyl-CoA dehydratese activating ATPase
LGTITGFYYKEVVLLTIGLDIGSITTKIAVMNSEGVVYTNVSFTGYNAEKAWRKMLKETLERMQLKESSVDRIVATGYGRSCVSIADKTVTEIKCHAQGARFYMDTAQSVIDIGGQDSKFIRIDKDGNVADFVMNDKCAAGTGRFLEVMARALEIDLDDFGKLSLRARKASSISSMCTVFAESEVISLIAKGESRENIVAGIHESIANRLQSMINRSGIAQPAILTGGVAQNIGIQTALEKKLKIKLHVPKTAQVNGAIGAAILAREI